MLIIAGTGGETLRVNVIPQRSAGKENDTAENVFISPLTVTGTAEELDREFASQLAGFRVSLERLTLAKLSRRMPPLSRRSRKTERRN